jgi:hypothetical protein
MAHKRQRSRPPPVSDHDLKRPVITGIIQGAARAVVYALIIHWRHWGL